MLKATILMKRLAKWSILCQPTRPARRGVKQKLRRSERSLMRMSYGRNFKDETSTLKIRVQDFKKKSGYSHYFGWQLIRRFKMKE